MIQLATPPQLDSRGRLNPEGLELLVARARQGDFSWAEPALLEALLAEAQAACALRERCREDEGLTRLRAQELAFQLLRRL